MTKEHLAKEASRLLSDDVLIGALASIREEALDALATADADDKTEILRQQAIVAVVDRFGGVLRRHIDALNVSRKPRAVA